MQKVNLIVEILKVLSERGEKFITTTEIFKELVERKSRGLRGRGSR